MRRYNTSSHLQWIMDVILLQLLQILYHTATSLTRSEPTDWKRSNLVLKITKRNDGNIYYLRESILIIHCLISIHYTAALPTLVSSLVIHFEYTIQCAYSCCSGRINVGSLSPKRPQVYVHRYFTCRVVHRELKC